MGLCDGGALVDGGFRIFFPPPSRGVDGRLLSAAIMGEIGGDWTGGMAEFFFNILLGLYFLLICFWSLSKNSRSSVEYKVFLTLEE
jgi:hypothetical protein